MKIFLLFGGMLVAALLQISFISSLPQPFVFMDLILAGLFLAAFFSGSFGISAALFATAILGAYSSRSLWHIALAYAVPIVIIAGSKKFIFSRFLLHYPGIVALFLYILPLFFVVSLSHAAIVHAGALDIQIALRGAFWSAGLMLLLYPLLVKMLYRHGKY